MLCQALRAFSKAPGFLSKVDAPSAFFYGADFSKDFSKEFSKGFSQVRWARGRVACIGTSPEI